jgi:putative aldouronate transport system substrate-binding protein
VDNTIYFLPFIDWDPVMDLRGQWIINQTWLNELRLSIPTTTEELKAVLTAFKNNAGRGTIPQNVAPLYFIFDDYTSGQFDIYGTFGVPITSEDYLFVDNDRVVYQATNPDLRAPLKYLQELYREGLIPPECFTDDYNTHTVKTSANPPIVASHFGQTIRVPTMQVPMAPVQSPSGKAPVWRRRAFVANSPQRFAIFENCRDPVAAIKLAEFIAFDIEANMTSTRGLKDVFWRFRPDGVIEEIFWETDVARMTANAGSMGFWNSFIGLWDHNFYANLFHDTAVDTPLTSRWGLENVYRPYLAPAGSTYNSASLNADETSLMNAYGTDLANERKQTFARWITTNANIDAEWDAYVLRMNRLHITEFIAFKQKAYDLLFK